MLKGKLTLAGRDAHAQSELEERHLLAMDESDSQCRCESRCMIPPFPAKFMLQVNYSNANKSIEMTTQELGTGEASAVVIRPHGLTDHISVRCRYCDVCASSCRSDEDGPSHAFVQDGEGPTEKTRSIRQCCQCRCCQVSSACSQIVALLNTHVSEVYRASDGRR